MRLEGWNIMMLLVMLVAAAAAVVQVTLLVRWTLRWARRRDDGNGSGPAPL
jgi:NADH:ubiquinone oxidoreductase subunit K